MDSVATSFAGKFTKGAVRRALRLVQAVDTSTAQNKGIEEPLEVVNEAFLRTANGLPNLSTPSRIPSGTPSSLPGGLSFCNPGPNMMAPTCGGGWVERDEFNDLKAEVTSQTSGQDRIERQMKGTVEAVEKQQRMHEETRSIIKEHQAWPMEAEQKMASKIFNIETSLS